MFYLGDYSLIETLTVEISGLVVADTSVRSPRKLLMFIRIEYNYWIEISRK